MSANLWRDGCPGRRPDHQVLLGPAGGRHSSAWLKPRRKHSNMPKIIAFDEEARRGLERGMNQLADA
ncbi:hypothetical protein MXD62_29260, partial [Frankia sp. Mgl5]|nr:hypothetical protein [Frankia sp. Mgl5]